MMPPATRKASRLMPSAASSFSPNMANTSRMKSDMTMARMAIERRCAGTAPLVRLA